ncbi:MAG: protein of unknown function DUF323 [Magnetococcales bacterium]|nr:protein of unknown function DUF323 [Magnetococcales bacterium]
MSVSDKTIFPRGGSGYADLLIAFDKGGPEVLEAMAGLVGFGQETRSGQVVKAEGTSSLELFDQATIQTEPKKFHLPDQLPIPFWHLVQCEFLTPLPRARVPAEKGEDQDPRPRMPSGIRLGGWNGVMTRVRALGTVKVPGRTPDLGRVVQCIVQGRVLDHLPRLPRRRWGLGVQIILDRAERLMPFQDDLDWAARRLAALFPRPAVEFVLLREEYGHPIIVAPGNRYKKYSIPPAGTLVLALGDMGFLAPDAARKAAFWEQWGAELCRHGCRPLALSPAPVWRMRPRWLPSWLLLPWKKGGTETRLSEAERIAQTERLLALLAPAVRIETGLLREIRLLLSHEADAGTEADCWTHPAMAGRSTMGGTLDPAALDWLWPRFAGEKDVLKKQVVATLRRWHNREGLAREVWDEEVLRLPASLAENDHSAARRRFKRLASKVVGSDPGGAWFRRVHRRADPTALYQHGDLELKAVQDMMYHAAFGVDPDHPPPPGFDLRHLGTLHETPVTIPLSQQGDHLVAGAAAGGSPLGAIHSRQDQVLLEPVPFVLPGAASLLHLQGDGKQATAPLPKRSAFLIKSDCEILTFGQMEKPLWAEAVGRDGHGLWVRIAVPGPGSQPVTQRLRWIPPGRFLMGSPKEEHGRMETEGPQHEVIFKQGFWLFDTACTQALWQAVMGGKPSKFRSPDQPVDNVDFNNVQNFIEKINQVHSDLKLTLPSEAQWEYACRAGTTTPFSFGADITPEQVNYDSNYPYRDGPKGKYRGQTVPVASLPSNPWGLYEMQGNVWEWCADVWHDSYAGAPTDGSVWDGPPELRVMRGGSWHYYARYVRAACRYYGSPAGRDVDLGFRCARAYDRMDF